MNPATKRYLARRAAELMIEADTQQQQADGLGKQAEAKRKLAVDLQALADAETNDIVQHIDASARDPYAREVQHIDTPEEEPAGIPPHVWLYRNMLTDMQRLAPLGIDETNGQYAVAIDQLTDEQCKIPHVSRQLPGDVLAVSVVGNHKANEIVQLAEVLTVAVDAGLKIEENGIVRRGVQS